MVDVVEVVLELEASGFINTGGVTRGRVVRTIPGGILACQVDDSIKGVAKPQGPFDNIEEARKAVIEYWDNCNIALRNANWMPKFPKY